LRVIVEVFRSRKEVIEHLERLIVLIGSKLIRGMNTEKRM